VILEEMAEEDVGVQKRNGHLLSHPLKSLINHGLLRGFAWLLGRKRWFATPEGSGCPLHDTAGACKPDLAFIQDAGDLISLLEAKLTPDLSSDSHLALSRNHGPQLFTVTTFL
jgi:hypothetical protein